MGASRWITARAVEELALLFGGYRLTDGRRIPQGIVRDDNPLLEEVTESIQVRTGLTEWTPHHTLQLLTETLTEDKDTTKYLEVAYHLLMLDGPDAYPGDRIEPGTVMIKDARPGATHNARWKEGAFRESSVIRRAWTTTMITSSGKPYAEALLKDDASGKVIAQYRWRSRAITLADTVAAAMATRVDQWMTIDPAIFLEHYGALGRLNDGGPSTKAPSLPPTKPGKKFAAWAMGLVAVIATLAWGVPRAVSLFADEDTPPASAPQSAPQSRPNAAASVVSPPPAEPTGPISQAVPVASQGPCTSEERTEAKKTSLFVEVPYWCHGTGLYHLDGSRKTGVTQWKLRLVVTNTTSEPMDISIDTPSTIRLLIEDDRDVTALWHPNQTTLDQGDTPVKVCVDGIDYWAIPPNVPLSEDYVTIELDGKDYETFTGFSSYWDKPGIIESGKTVGSSVRGDIGQYGEDGRPFKGEPGTDLVFEAPTSAKDPRVTMIAGVAIFEGPRSGLPPADGKSSAGSPSHNGELSTTIISSDL